MSSALQSLWDIEDVPPAVAILLDWGALLVGVLLAYLISRFVLLRLLARLAARTPLGWDSRLLSHRVPHRLSLIPSVVVLYALIPYTDTISEDAQSVLQRISTAVIVLSFTAALFALLTAVNEFYEKQDYAAERPIKGYMQLTKILLAIVAAILIVASLANLSPLLLLSGLGAATAVLMLIFQNTILSLVASVQLTTNDMIRIGDWITVPSQGADGDVIDIALHTVRIRSFDKTVVAVPTHLLISESFTNWRGMTEAGGRRIRRSILIDITSVRFLTDEELDGFADWPRLTEHLATKREELDTESRGHDPRAAATKAARRLTNVGLFRAYCEQYLRDRGDFHTEGMTLMARQLEATPEGLPLELYGFTTTTNWVEYESIQSDVFDHLFGIMPYFELHPFQRPSSTDIAGLSDPGDASLVRAAQS